MSGFPNTVQFTAANPDLYFLALTFLHLTTSFSYFDYLARVGPRSKMAPLVLTAPAVDRNDDDEVKSYQFAPLALAKTKIPHPLHDFSLYL
jgi:hypothetical protein